MTLDLYFPNGGQYWHFFQDCPQTLQDVPWSLGTKCQENPWPQSLGHAMLHTRFQTPKWEVLWAAELECQEVGGLGPEDSEALEPRGLEHWVSETAVWEDWRVELGR